MAGEVSGIDILLYINTGTPASPVWTLVGGQRGMTLRKATEVADAKHKSSGAWQNRVATFLDWSITGDMVKITADATQVKLNALWRARANVEVRALKEDSSYEQGEAVIADLSEGAPHDNVATIALDLQGHGELAEFAS